jgi:urease accessory protein
MKRKMIAALIALPSPALAHGLHDSGTLLAGAMHPLGGADHLLAMVAVGLLSGQMGGRAVWTLPLAFVAAMLIGGAAGAGGLAFPGVEPLILASIAVLGALVALAFRLPIGPVAAMIAVFGAAHGWAHGAEAPAGASMGGLVAYGAGFAGATAALHLAGIALGRALPAGLLRVSGAAAMGAGLVLSVA